MSTDPDNVKDGITEDIEIDVYEDKVPRSILVSGDLICGDCSHQTSTGYLLDKHMNLQHVRSESFPCDRCGTSYADEANLSSHMKKEHVQPSVIPVTVSIGRDCGKTAGETWRNPPSWWEPHVSREPGIRTLRKVTCFKNVEAGEFLPVISHQDMQHGAKDEILH